MIGLRKTVRELPSPCISNRSVMDISIDEDINKMPVQVLINLSSLKVLLSSTFHQWHHSRKKQKQWFFTIRIFFNSSASNREIRLSIDHVDKLTHVENNIKKEHK